MKYLLGLLLLVSFSINAEETKEFFFGQKVRVIKNFYKGCEGIVLAKFSETIYQVELECKTERNSSVTLHAPLLVEEMERVK